MKAGICVFVASLFLMSISANAKMVHRWDPNALAQGKFVVQKSAIAAKQEQKAAEPLKDKRILVKIDYTGKLIKKAVEVAKE